MDKFHADESFKPFPRNNDITSSTQDDNKRSPEAEDERQKLVQDFASYTTLHGLHFTLDSTSRRRRVIWICLLLCGFAFFFLQIGNNLVRLNAHEVVISKNVEFAKALHFPVVTICNQNMMRKSQIVGTIAQDYLDQMDYVKFFAGLKHKVVPSFDVGKTLQKAGHQIKDMIQYCEFAGVNCSTMNGHEFISATPSALRGLCYTFPVNSSALKKVGTGKSQGLQLRLNAEPNEYYGPYSYDATGFKIVVHEPGTYHDIDNKGYDISPGFYTSIRIKRKKTIYQPPPYPSKCGSKKLENVERYTQRYCHIECWSKITIKECDCRIVGLVSKGVEDVRFCNITEIRSCINPAFDRLNDDTEACGCPLECESIDYSIQTSMAYYPSKSLFETLIPFLEKTTGLNTSIPEQREMIQMAARKRLAAVTIFFEDISTDVTEEKSSYDISAFVSDAGGNMGLFMGCSLLTVFEFVDLIVMLCLKRRSKTSVKIAW